MTVNFNHRVFLPIRIQFNDKPELHSDKVFNAMQSRLKAVEAKEREQRKFLEQEKIKHRQIMESFLKQHKAGRNCPGKRPRFHEAMPTEEHTVQVNSVWTAKVDHI